MKSIINKFGYGDTQLSQLEGSMAYQLREKLDNGGKMTREEKNWLTEGVNHNTYSKTGIPVMGWMFPFSDVLNKYIVKQYNHWNEYNATDKTALRAMLYGRVEQIVEVKKEVKASKFF